MTKEASRPSPVNEIVKAYIERTKSQLTGPAFLSLVQSVKSALERFPGDDVADLVTLYLREGVSSGEKMDAGQLVNLIEDLGATLQGGKSSAPARAEATTKKPSAAPAAPARKLTADENYKLHGWPVPGKHAGRDPAVDGPAVPIAESYSDNTVVCLEDGRKMKMLKRHLWDIYGLSVEAYRAKWNLPLDHPVVAPSVSRRRSQAIRSMQDAGDMRGRKAGRR